MDVRVSPGQCAVRRGRSSELSILNFEMGTLIKKGPAVRNPMGDPVYELAGSGGRRSKKLNCFCCVAENSNVRLMAGENWFDAQALTKFFRDRSNREHFR